MATRVDKPAAAPPEAQKPKPKVSFASQLQKPQPVARAGRAAPTLLARNQKASAAFDAALHTRRTEAEQVRPEHRRLAQALAVLLVDPEAPPKPGSREVEPQSSKLPEPVAAPGQAQAQPQPLEPAAPREGAVAALAARLESLIARAEQLLRAEGPALQLELQQGTAAAIEVVRSAQGEVVVQLTARSARDRAALRAKLPAIRAALAEQGLAVKRLTLAR